MAIERVEITDFLVFKGKFEAEFSSGVNVIIGGNGCGKTTLLKAMYMGCRLARNRQSLSQIEMREGYTAFQKANIHSYFNYIAIPHVLIKGLIKKDGQIISKDSPMNVSFEFGADVPSSISLHGINDSNEAVFIPSDEVLSHSKSLLALNNEREIPFDKTYIDVLSKAALGVTHEITPNAALLLDKIKAVIGGEVVYENDIFYIAKDSGDLIPFSLEAHGYRKLGLIWKLLRNGLLESGSILFWDEPENSVNPDLIHLLAEIIMTLSRNGVQVFLTTHDDIMASYVAVKCFNGDKPLFIVLYKDNGQIMMDINDRFDLLEPNNLIAEPVKLYELELEKGLNGNG